MALGSHVSFLAFLKSGPGSGLTIRSGRAMMCGADGNGDMTGYWGATALRIFFNVWL